MEVVSRTSEETKAFKEYLYKYHPYTVRGNHIDKLQYFKKETNALWIRFDENKEIISHQTVSHTKDAKRKQRIYDNYFYNSRVIPYYAFIDPENYPEYFI